MENKVTREEMLDITGRVIGYLDSWELAPHEVFNILGLPEEKPRNLPQYRKMQKSLPQSEEVFKRIDHIVGIGDALRTTYPFSDKMRLLWLRKPHRRFRRNTPLSVILQEGVNGLMRVRMEVDCAYGWAINDAMQAQSAAKN